MTHEDLRAAAELGATFAHPPYCEDFVRLASPARILSILSELDRKTAALERAADTMTAMVEIADQARDEWDAAPQGMKAGKILIALAGHMPGYRHDIDAIHANIAATRTALEPDNGR